MTVFQKFVNLIRCDTIRYDMDMVYLLDWRASLT